MVLADARSGGVPPKEGARGTYKYAHTRATIHGQGNLLVTVKSFIVDIKFEDFGLKKEANHHELNALSAEIYR